MKTFSGRFPQRITRPLLRLIVAVSVLPAMVMASTGTAGAIASSRSAARPSPYSAPTRPQSQSPGVPRSAWVRRATASYMALQHYLYLGPAQHNLYLEYYPKQPGDNDYSYLFDFSEATTAALDMTGLPAGGPRYDTQVSDEFSAMDLYGTTQASLPDEGTNWIAPKPVFESYLPPPLGTSGDAYYDDNDLVGLNDVLQYQHTQQRAYLQSAQSIFEFETHGWDTDTTRACPGGLHWVDANWNDISAANVTGLSAQLAAHLYEITREPSYLAWALRLYDWNSRCLQQSPGLYWNDMAYSGSIDKTLWIYNSGAMIGAMTVLYRATHDPRYLSNAVSDAQGAIAYWTENQRYFYQPAVFNAIFFEDLLLLDSVHPDATYLQVIANYAQEAWQNFRDPATGLFRLQPSGGGPYDPTARPQTVEQSSMVQIFAILAWSPDSYWRAA